MKNIRMSKKDILIIKEDAIKIKEKDIEDTVKSLSYQSIISYYAVSVILLFYVILFKSITIFNLKIIVLLLLFWFILLLIWFYNILSIKINIHSDMSWVFLKKNKFTYDKYLDKRYEKLKIIYSNAKKGLIKKANINRKLYILSGLFILTIIILTLFIF